MSSLSLTSRLSSVVAPPIVVLLSLFLVATNAALAAEGKPLPAHIDAVHERVERAFVRCDGAFLRPILSRRVKTFVASRALAPKDGYYGADQLLLLFERLFEGRTTIKFTALSAEAKPRRDGRASLPIRWTSSRGSQARNELSLSLILALEGVEWQIREIRDLK